MIENYQIPAETKLLISQINYAINAWLKFFHAPKLGPFNYWYDEHSDVNFSITG